MPGIFGIVSNAARADLSNLFDGMAQRLKHHPWYREDRHLDQAAGIALGRSSLGFVDRAEQPAANEDRSLLAVMAGEVYDYAEKRQALTATGHEFRGTSHAELLLHGYESQGKKFFADLDGYYAAAIWDARNRQLILVNDRFGMRQLYYARLPGRLLLASEIKALLLDPEVSRKNNLRGIAQFFAFGQLLAEDTFLEDVHLLPAAGWLVYDVEKDVITLDRYWRPTGGQQINGRSDADFLDRVDTAFKRAVDRRVEGTNRLGISLSGGLDSRTILAVIDPDRPVHSVCMGMEGSIDHRCAQRMTKLVNRPHHSYLLNDDFLSRFEEHMRHMVCLTDGHYLSQCIVLPTLPVYRELGIEVLLRGHAGELMHMDKAYNFSLDAEGLAIHDEASLEDWLFRHLRAYMVETVEGPLFAPAYQDEVQGLARDSLRSCLRETAGVEPPLQRVWQLFISQRLRRETALSMVKFGSVVETRLPFLDNDLIDVFRSAPPEQKLGDKIQAHILRRRMPAFLDVVNANTGARVGAGPLALFVAKVRLKVLSKLRVRGYQPYERLGLWLRRELRSFVKQLLLSEQCLERGIFNPQTVKAVVEQHLNAQRNHTFLLLALMIFELGQRELLDGGDIVRKTVREEKVVA